MCVSIFNPLSFAKKWVPLLILFTVPLPSRGQVSCTMLAFEPAGRGWLQHWGCAGGSSSTWLYAHSMQCTCNELALSEAVGKHTIHINRA